MKSVQNLVKRTQGLVTQMRTCSIRKEDVGKGGMKAEMELGKRLC